MMVGRVLGRLPLVVVELPGHGKQVPVEFVLDTGFDGELALPPNVLQRLDASFNVFHPIHLADRSEKYAARYEIEMFQDEEIRLVEIVEIDGRPLMGNGFTDGMDIHIEMTEGGQVLLEPM
jgi:predicted aspartyl protease